MPATWVNRKICQVRDDTWRARRTPNPLSSDLPRTRHQPVSPRAFSSELLRQNDISSTGHTTAPLRATRPTIDHAEIPAIPHETTLGGMPRRARKISGERKNAYRFEFRKKTARDDPDPSHRRNSARIPPTGGPRPILPSTPAPAFAGRPPRGAPNAPRPGDAPTARRARGCRRIAATPARRTVRPRSPRPAARMP